MQLSGVFREEMRTTVDCRYDVDVPIHIIEEAVPMTFLE